ncbi:uncharacterized protein BJ171DRAFT_491449 [Polychytrium aggregatum]|uniref:uncharacterized protein n=1 Tax=Polychytrium aggregatum TaxID=110093 RepID=UPI0022FF1403|nr:uncharacterized protein BJ171DRAFT_491449 [Polychytrium aggregatum]KAI9207778.1 hypothetical protein BJ171DRAFT_491449 [Polychytrium aggregatum]
MDLGDGSVWWSSLVVDELLKVLGEPESPWAGSISLPLLPGCIPKDNHHFGLLWCLVDDLLAHLVDSALSLAVEIESLESPSPGQAEVQLFVQHVSIEHMANVSQEGRHPGDLGTWCGAHPFLQTKDLVGALDPLGRLGGATSMLVLLVGERHDLLVGTLCLGHLDTVSLLDGWLTGCSNDSGEDGSHTRVDPDPCGPRVVDGTDPDLDPLLGSECARLVVLVCGFWLDIRILLLQDLVSERGDRAPDSIGGDLATKELLSLLPGIKESRIQLEVGLPEGLLLGGVVDLGLQVVPLETSASLVSKDFPQCFGVELDVLGSGIAERDQCALCSRDVETLLGLGKPVGQSLDPLRVDSDLLAHLLVLGLEIFESVSPDVVDGLTHLFVQSPTLSFQIIGIPREPGNDHLLKDHHEEGLLQVGQARDLTGQNWYDFVQVLVAFVPKLIQLVGMVGVGSLQINEECLGEGILHQLHTLIDGPWVRASRPRGLGRQCRHWTRLEGVLG